MSADDRPEAPKASTLTGYAAGAKPEGKPETAPEAGDAIANTLPAATAGVRVSNARIVLRGEDTAETRVSLSPDAPPNTEPEPHGPPAELGDLALPRLDRARYEDLQEVGRGGLGRVLRVRDIYLDRHVAVKELLDHAGDGSRPDAASTTRFVREALITARLQHPAIVPIYDAGHTDGTDPFYAMKLVEGRSLADVLRDKRTLEERLALLPAMITVADAMAYAHRQRIIHRDLKPQNVLLGEFRETIIIDWGLAKDLSSDAEPSHKSIRPGARAAASSSQAHSATIAGAVMGTPAYMSPEQALGEDVDERTDVYALGAMLYHVITGVMPREGRSVDELLVKAATGEIAPIASLEPNAPADLAAIVGKAMALKTSDRYPTAFELAEDLHRFQTGQLVGVYRYTRSERFARWVRRNAAVVAVAAILGAILAGYAAWSVRKIFIEKRAAQAAADEALAAKADAERNAAAARTQTILVRARQYAASGHTAEEIALLRALAQPTAGREARELAIENGLVWKSHQRLAMAVGRDVTRAFRSADGSRFIAVEPHLVRAWEVATGAEVARLPLAPGDLVAAISPGGHYAAIASCNPPCTWSGGAIAAVKSDVGVAIRELATAATAERWTTPHLDATTIAFAPDDSAVAYRIDAAIHVRDLGTGATQEWDGAACPGPFAIAPRDPRTGGGAATPGAAAAVPPVAPPIALGCGETIEIRRTGGPAQIVKAPGAQVAFVASDRLLAVTSGSALLWDVAAGELRGSGQLPATQGGLARNPRDREMSWRVRTGAVSGDVTEMGEPQVTTTPELPRAWVTAPGVRGSFTQGGPRIATFDGEPWRAFAIPGRDQVSIAMLDDFVPPLLPSARCIARAGGERHALVALDHGSRLLVDEQELAAGLLHTPAGGYTRPSVAELPVRQLRPAVAAENDACLVWGGARGAAARDAGPFGAARTAIVDDRGGIALASEAAVVHVDSRGTRTDVTVARDFVVADTGAHVATVDLVARELVIRATATNAVVRKHPFPPAARVSRLLEWKASDVVDVNIDGAATWVPLDPALPVRAAEPELVTDTHGPYGLRSADGKATLVRVADGGAAGPVNAIDTGSDMRIFPDGRVLVYAAAGTNVYARDGKRTPLSPGLPEPPLKSDVTGDHIIIHMRERVAVYNLSTGRGVTLPSGSRAAAIAGDEVWTISGLARPRLVRARIDQTGSPRAIDLATPHLPFRHVSDAFEVSPDRTRITASYAVTEELSAYATWSAETGALLWVGAPTGTVAGDWYIAGGRIFTPRFDIDGLLADTGARTNLRVCERDLRAVAVTPPPPPTTYWAPESACGGAGSAAR